MSDFRVEDARNAIGELAPHVVPLETLAADLDDETFSNLVYGLKSAVTRVGNHIARLRPEHELSTKSNRLPQSASPETKTATGR